MQIRWHRGRVLMAVGRRNLPSAAADAAEPPPAFAEPWIAEATQAPLTGTVPSSDGADGSPSIEHGLCELARATVPGAYGPTIRGSLAQAQLVSSVCVPTLRSTIRAFTRLSGRSTRSATRSVAHSLVSNCSPITTLNHRSRSLTTRYIFSS